jgi:trigger factor
METKLTSQTETQAEFNVVATAEQLAHAKSHVFDELRPRVKAAGFRPGKAPDMIVERELGSQHVQSEVLEHAVQDTYSEAVRELKLPVVAQPEVTLEKFVPYTALEYKAKVDLMPTVKLPKYQDYKLPRPLVTPDPGEVDRTLNELRRREAVRLAVDRPAAKGDEVNFDFDGTKDGEPVRGASAKGQTLQLGSGSFIPGFEDELIGLKTGDDKSFDIRFPKDYHESSLAGQVVKFAVKINSVTELALPEIDDELVARVSPFKTVDELKADIAEQSTRRQADEASRQYEQQLLDKVLQDSDFKAPESLVQQQLTRLRSELEQNLSYSGLDMAKYLEMSKKSAEELETEMRPEAERRVGLAMVLTEVAKAENISVNEPELDAEIARMKQQYTDAETQAELDNPRTREEVYNHLMASRVIAKLISYADAK